MNKKTPENYKVIAENRKARHNYEILEDVEAGIVLTGTEVKSLRAGKVSLQEAWAKEIDEEFFLMQLHISEYDPAGQFNHDPTRARKLLLNRREIKKLIGKVSREGLTLVPLVLYFNHRGIIKLKLALAKGKNKADKRETIKQRDWQRDKARLLKS